MKNVVDFPDCEAVDEEALAWLVRLDGDKPLSVSEEKVFEEWLSRSPAHREALKSLNVFWAHCNVLGELVEPTSVTEICKKRTLSYFFMFSSFGRAATAMVFIVGLVLTNWFGSQGITDSNGLYSTVVGQQKTIMLVDGSQMQLNTNSQIQVDYNTGFRNIRLLQGEVHFEVAKDKSKPFRVYAGNGRVQAVGTAFNVYLKKGDVDVFVTEGEVALASILPVALSTLHSDIQNESSNDKSKVNVLGIAVAGQGVTLKTIQIMSQGKEKDISEVQFVTELVLTNVNDQKPINALLAWRKGLLIFSGESLEEVVEEISRYIPVSIEIVDPELRKIQIGGQIRVADTDSMFKALEANFGLKINRLGYNRVQIVTAP